MAQHQFKFSPEELKARTEKLVKCFQMFDMDRDGVLNEKEMEKVARAFSPDKGEAALLEDVKVIMDKLNTKQTGAIDEEEWVSFLLTMFQFMNAAAFERHCNELLAVVDGIEKASQASGKR